MTKQVRRLPLVRLRKCAEVGKEWWKVRQGTKTNSLGEESMGGTAHE